MNDSVEIWEFADREPSGTSRSYRLEERAGRLRIYCDAPDFAEREAQFGEDQVLAFLKHIIKSPDQTCSRTELDRVFWHEQGDPGKVSTCLKKLRKLLKDDANADRSGNALGGRIIQSLRGGDLHFALETAYSKARIQKTAPLSPYSSVPSLYNFVARPELLEPLVAELCQCGSTGAIAITGIAGMGGVGKTTLALALCHDNRVRETFADGIIWLRFGPEMESEFGRRVKEICDHLDQRFDDYSTSALQTVLDAKSVLIVLDDIWNIGDLEAFRVPSQRSRLLFTTRDKAIARSAGIVGKEIGELDAAQARAVLKRWSHREEHLPEPHASDILSECGGLALAISMIGAALSDESPDEWERMLSKLRKAKLKHIGSRISEYRYDTIHAAIAVSVEALTKELRAYYLRLAVLLEGTPAGVSILQALWGGDEDAVYDRMRMLVDRSLVRREPSGIIPHDLQLKYLRSECENSEALELQRAALRRSIHVLRDDPKQFASQLTGRLLGHRDVLGISEFLESLDDNAPLPWLRPLLACLPSPRDASLQMLQDRSWNCIESVALSSDGTKAILATGRARVVYWEKHNSTLRVEQLEPTTRYTARIAANGKCAFCCGHAEGTLYRWDLENEGPPIAIVTLGRSVRAFAISDDCGRAAIVFEDGTFGICEIDVEAAPIERRNLKITNDACDLSADGSVAVFGCRGGLWLWEMHSEGEPTFISVDGDIASLALTPDGHQVVFSHGRDQPCNVSLLSIRDARGPRTLWADPLPITSLCISADGKRIAGAGHRGRIVVCDCLAGNTLREYRSSDSDLDVLLAMSADGRWGISARRGSVQCVFWDFEAPPSSAHSEDPVSIAVSKDSRRLISMRNDGALKVWVLGESPESSVISPPKMEEYFGGRCDIALSEGGSHVLGCKPGGKYLYRWELNKGSLPETLYPYRTLTVFKSGGPVPLPHDFDNDWDLSLDHTIDGQGVYDGQCSISSDGKRALAKLHKGPVIVWDFAEHWNASHSLRDSEEATAFIVVGDGQFGLVGTRNGDLSLWDLNARIQRVVLGSHGSAVKTLVFVKSSRFVSISGNGALWVWDIDSKIHSHQVGRHEIQTFAFSSDGRWMFSTWQSPQTGKHTSIVWDLDARTTRLFTLPTDIGWVQHVSLNDDGSLLAYSASRSLVVCDVRQGKKLAAYTGDAWFTSLRWAGERIVAIDDIGRTHILAWED